MKRIALNVIGIILIVFIAYKLYYTYTRDIKVISNDSLKSHMIANYPQLEEFVSLADDRKDTSKKYLQIIYYAKESDPSHRVLFKDVFTHSLKAVYENTDNLDDLSAISISMLEKKTMKDYVIAIVGFNIIKKMSRSDIMEKDFESIRKYLAKECPKTDPSKSLSDYCVIKF